MMAILADGVSLGGAGARISLDAKYVGREFLLGIAAAFLLRDSVMQSSNDGNDVSTIWA